MLFYALESFLIRIKTVRYHIRKIINTERLIYMEIIQRHPPKIIHLGRPSGHTQMAIEAAKNVRLNKRATRLLLFYEDQMDGFPPA
jgi:hypothetical protein